MSQKCHKHIPSTTKKKKSEQWELVFGNSGTTFDLTSKKKKQILHTFNAVTVQNAQGLRKIIWEKIH
jgi:hypothetical protein